MTTQDTQRRLRQEELLRPSLARVELGRDITAALKVHRLKQMPLLGHRSWCVTARLTVAAYGTDRLYSALRKRDRPRDHSTTRPRSGAIFATKNIFLAGSGSEFIFVALASPRRTFAALHLALALWYPAPAAASSSSSAFHWASSFWRTPADGVLGAAAHLHQQLHGLGRPVAPTLSSAHLSAPPVG